MKRSIAKTHIKNGRKMVTNIFKFIEENDLSISQFADLAGLATGTIRNMIRAYKLKLAYSPAHTTVIAVSAVMGIPKEEENDVYEHALEFVDA